MNTIMQAIKTNNTNISKTTVSEIIELIRDIQNRSPGLNIEFKQDFRHFLELIEENQDRKELSPMFDPRYCSIGADNGFWIKGTNDDGEVVHLQAVRFDDLGQTTLSKHWHKNRLLYRPPGIQPDFEKS